MLVSSVILRLTFASDGFESFSVKLTATTNALKRFSVLFGSSSSSF